MEILVVLSVLFGCGVAVPQVPPNFYTKMSVQYWNGSTLTFEANDGYAAQDHDRNTSIMCMKYTPERISCYMTTMQTNSTELISIYYVALLDGTLLVCEQKTMDTTDFHGLFDWVRYTYQAGKCNDTCNEEVERWEYDLGDNASISIGVTEKDPNIPVLSKYVANLTIGEEQRYIVCYTEFQSEVPPDVTFAIPNICQSVSRNAELGDPEEIRDKMADYMQHHMKLNSRVRPQL